MNKPIFTFSASADNVGHIFIDGPIGEDWWADDGGNTARKLSALIDECKSANCGSYHVKIHSLGGDVDHALAIYSMLKELGNVTTEVIGMCASAATIIFMAGSERIMDESALFLVHHCWSYSNGNAIQMERTVETMKTIDETMINIYTSASGISRKEVEDLMDANDGDGRWITAKECKEKKLCTATTSNAKAASRQQFFAAADLRERNLPIPEQLEELSPSTWAKITNLIKSLTTKPKATMKKFSMAAYVCLATIIAELSADENDNILMKAEDLQKIEDAMAGQNSAKADLEKKIKDLEKQAADAAAEKDTLTAKVAELQALIDKKPAANTGVNGQDPQEPDSFEAYQQNSSAYQAAEQILKNY